MHEHSRLLSHSAPKLRTKEMTRSLSFYQAQLGFKLVYLYENFYGSVVRDGCHIHLQCRTPFERDQTAFERGEHLDACVIVRDAHALSQSLAAAQVIFTVPLRQMPFGTEFYVRDPDGYILGFVQPAPDEETT